MVSVTLRTDRGKLYAQATFATEHGPLTIDHIFVRPGAGRPRIGLPTRPDGGLWVPIIRLPDAMFAALQDAISEALQP